MSKSTNQNRAPFLVRQRNLIIALFVVAAVLAAGYFAIRAALAGEEPPVNIAEQELLPGEVMSNGSRLVYEPLDSSKLKSVKIHNPANRAVGEQYVDWGVGFAYDEEAKNSYAFILGSDYLEIDDEQLAYFCAGVGVTVVASRLEDHCADFSPYGLDKSPEELLTVTVETVEGNIHILYIGNINPGGNGYYVRSADTVTDSEGNSYVRDSVYLLNQASSSYLQRTVAAAPMAMLTKLLTFPVASSFSSFALASTDGSVDVSFLQTGAFQTAVDLFSGSNLYRSVTPEGFFASSQFETRITQFQEFCGEEVMEFATEIREGEDEDGKYTYPYFPEEVLEKYGLDPAHLRYMLAYSAVYAETSEHLLSEVYFSAQQPDGYYYAYSLCYNTICRVSPDTVDFLRWRTIDFLDPTAVRISIGYIKNFAIEGKKDGQDLSLSFTQQNVMDEDGAYLMQSAVCDQTGAIDLTAYRNFFRVLFGSYVQGEVPDTLDRDALKESDPYLVIRIKTDRITVYKKNAGGKITNQVDCVIEPAERILRFYRYSNGRALMTSEYVEADGTTTGESGLFYVLLDRLDKLLSDAEKVSKNQAVDVYGRE